MLSVGNTMLSADNIVSSTDNSDNENAKLYKNFVFIKVVGK
jgi:hypothetical protein